MIYLDFSFNVIFDFISSLNTYQGIHLQRDHIGEAEEGADTVEELGLAVESGPEMAASCSEEKGGDRKGGGRGESLSSSCFSSIVKGKEKAAAAKG